MSEFSALNPDAPAEEPRVPPTTFGRALAIGVTGNIGSGKTEVCRIFQSLGGTIILADDIAKQLMETDTRIHRSIGALFETPVYRDDGTLDRKALARIIFSDDSARAKIEAIVHPRVIEYLSAEIRQLKDQAKSALLFVESALVYETKIEQIFDYIILVHAEPELADRRVMERDGMAVTEIAARRRTQLSIDKKIDRADFTIYNNGNIDDLSHRCRFLYNLFMTLTTT